MFQEQACSGSRSSCGTFPEQFRNRGGREGESLMSSASKIRRSNRQNFIIISAFLNLLSIPWESIVVVVIIGRRHSRRRHHLLRRMGNNGLLLRRRGLLLEAKDGEDKKEMSKGGEPEGCETEDSGKADPGEEKCQGEDEETDMESEDLVKGKGVVDKKIRNVTVNRPPCPDKDDVPAAP